MGILLFHNVISIHLFLICANRLHCINILPMINEPLIPQEKTKLSWNLLSSCFILQPYFNTSISCLFILFLIQEMCTLVECSYPWTTPPLICILIKLWYVSTCLLSQFMFVGFDACMPTYLWDFCTQVHLSYSSS